MSNVLGPIVARYSLFFTLALSDSSRLARSRHPRQLVLELVQRAQERFQSHYHARTARKLRALIRNMSSASTSSSKTQHSQSSNTSVGATFTSGILTPLSSNISGSLDSCPPCISSFPVSGEDSDCSMRNNAADVTVTAGSINHQNIDYHCASTSTLPSPPPSPLFLSKKNHIQSLAELSPVDYSSIPSAVHETSPLPLQKSTRSKSHKTARRRRSIKAFSIATLLSITLTMIILSLLQNRRRSLRKKVQQSQSQKQERKESCDTNSVTQCHLRMRAMSMPSSNPSSKHNHRLTYPMAGAISVDEMVVRDHLAINGTMDGHLSTWLEHQGLHDHEVSFGSLLYETRDMSKINQGADNDMQLQHYRAQHFPYIDRHAQVHPHRRHNSLSVPSFAYGPPTRSAHELAWERHHYYQRLQYEEEERALRILHAKLQDQDQLSDTRHLNQDTVARASSLNRLATPSQLSKETSRILGLCRSSTISTSSTKRASVAVMESASRPASPMFDSSFDYYSNTLENEDTSGQRNGRSRPIGDTIHSEASQSEPISLATLTPTSLSRRKTLKNHLTPSLRLLARRCSTRFGSIRPYSYAGTGSDPIVEYPQGRRSSGSRSRSSSSSNGGHMCDFKPLKVGPETSEMLRQQQELHQMNQSLEHVPIKKTSSLFRSKSTRASSSDLVLSRGQVAQSETLPFPNKRNSQRSIKSLESVNTDTNSMYLDTKQYASQTAIPVSTVAYESIVNDKERESVKKQIVSIISSGWKDLRSKSSKTMLNQRPPSRTSQCLSPLAVEAQENIPEPEDQEEGFLDIKMGPGEHFSFLLVPRSEYEFQPLVAQ